MATTNNERVGQALGLLAEGLAPFVDRECGLKYGTDWDNAVSVDGPRSKTDIQFLLRTMTSTWREVFERTLGRMERNYVSELIDARNDCVIIHRNCRRRLRSAQRFRRASLAATAPLPRSAKLMVSVSSMKRATGLNRRDCGAS